MAISIVVSDTVRFKVTGTITQEDGTAKPFDFWLTCERISSTEDVQAYLQLVSASDSATPITDCLLPKVRGWAGVKGPDGQDMPFTEDNFRALMRLPGLAYLTHTTYLREVGAKEKN